MAEPDKHGPTPLDTDVAPAEESGETVDALLEGVPEDEAMDVRVAIAQSRAFQGPLPPPAMYAEYEEILPGSAERILAMSEKEQEHRHRWETKDIGFAGIQAISGQIFGFLIMMGLIAGAVYSVHLGEIVAAGAFLGAAAVGAVGKFVLNRWSRGYDGGPTSRDV